MKVHLPRRCFSGFSPQPKFFLVLSNSTFQFFMASVMKFKTLSDILYISWESIIQNFSLKFEWQQISSGLQGSSQYSSKFFNSDIVWVVYIFPLILSLFFLLLFEFFTPPLADSKSPQVSRTLLSILADLSNAVVSMVSTHPLASKSPSPSTNPLVTVPRVPITIGITVAFMFPSFFNSLTMSRYFSFFSFSFNFTLWSAWATKSTIRQILFSFLFFIISRCGRLAEIRWSICISKFQRGLCILFFRTDSGECTYYL